MLVNLRLAFPEWSETQRRVLARQSWIQLVWNVIDIARSARWGEAEFREHVSIDGVECLEKALGQGKGALVLTLHMGNFELAIRALPRLEAPFSAVGRAMRNPWIREHIFAQRERMGAVLLPSRRVAPKILRALGKGHAVPILNDQYVRPSKGVWAPLFGVRCSTSPGIATLSLRSGAPIVPCFTLRDEPDHHRIIFLPALQFDGSGDRPRDIEALTALCNEATEAIIRKHPEQWMWSHRRFRYSPDLPEHPYRF
jgi:KDO2-lipid IV(A) lauroyltransferase